MRRLDGAAAALPEGAFTIVMATGIVALACRDVLPALADALLCIAAAGLVVIGILIGSRRARPDRANPWWDMATFVAAAATVAAGLRAGGHATPANGLDVAAVAGWLSLVARPAPWVGKAGRSLAEDVSGRRLLALVATQSAVIAAATLARYVHAAVLDGAVLAVWTIALLLYVPMVAPVMRGIATRARAGSFRADDWICMGALAISALAAHALLRMPGAPLRPEVRAVGLAVLAGAFLWIPSLARLDAAARRVRRWPPGAERWSTIFTLGMFAAACQAMGHAASVSTAVRLGRASTWLAVAAWAVVAAGCARPRAGVTTAARARTGRRSRAA